MESLKRVKWNDKKKHILFCSSPTRPEKNFKLVKDACSIIDDESLELHFLENIKNSDIPYYLNAANVVLLSSLWEGSPNVIKEAMACNTPISSRIR